MLGKGASFWMSHHLGVKLEKSDNGKEFYLD